MIWAALPEELRSITRPIAARDYWANTPVKRWITTEVFNAVYVERRRGAPCRSGGSLPCANRWWPKPAPQTPSMPAERIEPSMEPLLPPMTATGTARRGRARSTGAARPSRPPAPPAPPESPRTAAPKKSPVAAPAPAVDPLAPLVEALRSGDSIIIFPEGTRGHTGEPQKFQSGLYTLATMFPEWCWCRHGSTTCSA